MEFFAAAIDVLKTLVIALGAGLGVWGIINLLEGYDDNPGCKIARHETAYGRRRCSTHWLHSRSVVGKPVCEDLADVWTISYSISEWFRGILVEGRQPAISPVCSMR